MGQVTGVATFDRTAAFDTVDHDLLCQKLSGLGAGRHEVRWFMDYLGGGSQRVRYNESLSSPSPAKYGVLKGSLLGPMLFPTLIHDLPQVMDISPILTSSGGTVGYADDILIWFSGPSIEAVKVKLEPTARAVVEYMAVNLTAILGPVRLCGATPQPVGAEAACPHEGALPPRLS